MVVAGSRPSDLDRLERLRGDLERCFRCSLCKMVPLPVVKHAAFSDACPASRLFHFHGYSTSGKQLMALSLIDGRIEADERLAHVAFACTACGYGDVACKFIMDAERHAANMALKELLVERGLGLAAHGRLVEDLVRDGHPCGPGARPAGEWAKGLGLKIVPRQRAGVLLFAGCAQRGSREAARVARLLALLLLRAEVDVGILDDDEPCCGAPAYWTGHRKQFIEIARRTRGQLDGSGVGMVVVTSGTCLGTFRAKYPEYAEAVRPRLLHAVELIADLLKQGRLRLDRPVEARVTYHDPCYLGRQSEPPVAWQGEEKRALGCMSYFDPPRPVNRGTGGVFDAPRQVLARIPRLDLVEMYRIREYAFCCGAGGGVPEAYPELARSAALHRLQEARTVGAERLVTACASCEANFRRAQCDEAEPLPVVDIIELVAEAAGIDE